MRCSRSPASVSETLRVVRARSRTPNRASSLPTAWLTADCEAPSFAAARVKPPSRATVRNAVSWLNSSPFIDKLHR